MFDYKDYDIELNNQIATNKIFHTYVNPKRSVSEEAYKIQEIAYEYWVRKKLFGWKIAATSKVGQMHIGVKGPMAGRLIRERLALNKQIISLKHNQMKVVEAEFAFKLLNLFNFHY